MQAQQSNRRPPVTHTAKPSVDDVVAAMSALNVGYSNSSTCDGGQEDALPVHTINHCSGRIRSGNSRNTSSSSGHNSNDGGGTSCSGSGSNFDTTRSGRQGSCDSDHLRPHPPSQACHSHPRPSEKCLLPLPHPFLLPHTRHKHTSPPVRVAAVAAAAAPPPPPATAATAMSLLASGTAAAPTVVAATATVMETGRQSTIAQAGFWH